MRWLRAYPATSHGWRRARDLIVGAAAPAALATSRWRRRAVLLTSPHASLQVRQRSDGTWRLDDVSAWPVGAAHARPLLARVCAAADTTQVTITLHASSPKVAAVVYAPLGFQAAPGSRLMVRRPRPTGTDRALLG